MVLSSVQYDTAMAMPTVGNIPTTNQSISTNLPTPRSVAFYPVHEIVGFEKSNIVAVVAAVTAWETPLSNVLSSDVEGIHVVLMNDCNQSYTYNVNGSKAVFEGEGDLHERKFSHYKVQVDLAAHLNPKFTSTSGHCQYKMHLYPTSRLWSAYDSDTPEAFAAVVATCFFFIALSLYIYDVSVIRRNEKLVVKAAQSSSIVTSLFPDNIRERLVAAREGSHTIDKNPHGLGERSLRGFLRDDSNYHVDGVRSKPLADLFLETTVLFGDIAGKHWTGSSSLFIDLFLFVLLN